ncbi:MAG: 3-deoxy-D-manno-octulosonic acid transferase [Gemmatimonadales bacterium]
MPRPSLAYRVATRAAAAALPLVGRLLGGKVARSVRSRQGVLERMEAWGKRQRDITRPLVWMHAPSVGEGLQAAAVLRELRRRHPDWQVAYTHFSPSAEAFATNQQADFTDYLPWDTSVAAARALAALRPSALVYSKVDVWPTMACAATEAKVPVALIAATVSPLSSRLRWPAHGFLRPGYATLHAAGAVSTLDAERLAKLGTPPDRIEVLGDPRFDSVLSVIDAVAPDDPALRFRHGAPILVAGSTWPADERLLLRAFAEVRRVHPEARLILAPHEPTPRHLVGIRAGARRWSLPDPVTLDEAGPDAMFVMVDRVGVLARLYGSGAMAYVGGGFGSAGLHSVLEPAGWAVPVAFGPRWQNSREAGLLLEVGAAEVLDLPDPARQLAAWWSRMLAERGDREQAGRAAAAVIDAGRGAAVRQAEMVEGLVSR